MASAKDIVIEPIKRTDANNIIRQLHYSGKVCNGTQISFGVFLDGQCGGAIQMGASLDKRKTVELVEGTDWNAFIEINRIAFADWLPRNGESRAISISLRMLKKHYPHIKWVLSYADATQCGDGTIYRACGFVLTNIKPNKSIVRLPDGSIHCEMTFEDNNGRLDTKRSAQKPKGISVAKWLKSIGAEYLDGYQLRYIYFLDPSYRERLTVPEIPYSKIDEMGIGMYKGVKRTPGRGNSAPTESGGAIPTRPLQQAARVI
jgi:hypothetical protein